MVAAWWRERRGHCRAHRTCTVAPSSASSTSRGSDVNIRIPLAPGTLPPTLAAPRVTSVPMLPEMSRRPVFEKSLMERAAYHQP